MKALDVSVLPPTRTVLVWGAAVLAAVSFTHLARGFAQTEDLKTRFDVAAIRPGRDCYTQPFKTSPAGIDSACSNVVNFISLSYGVYADGHRGSAFDSALVEGGPPWARSEYYKIEAKAPKEVARELSLGPMLQALLEHRFKLKLHWETRQAPVYMLTKARSGAGLKPFKEGSCVPADAIAEFPPPQNYCVMRSTHTAASPNATLEARGVTSAEIGKWLGLYLDRPVIDQTGLAGRFDVNLEFTDSLLHPGQAPAPEAPGDISIFTAVREQLGFKLEPGKGPVKVIVIDHLERPSEN